MQSIGLLPWWRLHRWCSGVSARRAPAGGCRERHDEHADQQEASPKAQAHGIERRQRRREENSVKPMCVDIRHSVLFR